MLARCPRCDKPFVDTGDGRCPRCGEAEASSEGERTPPEPETRAVVVEGGADGPAPRRPRSGIPAPPPRFREGRPALEDPARPLLSRYFGTLADVCFRPVGFFTHLSRAPARGITWFAFLSVLVGSAAQAGWNLLLLPLLTQASASTSQLRGEDLEALRRSADDSALARLFLDLADTQAKMLEQLPLLEAQLWVALLLAPLTAFFTIHLVAGLLHLSVQPFRAPGDERIPYEVTYRFTVYALAPLVLAALPTVGGLAGMFTLAVLAIAMARLHRLRAPGVIGGVLGPVLLLSWLWAQGVLPRVAPPVATAVGLLPAPAAHEPPAEDDAAAALAALPPMPAPDRDHSVDITERDGVLETSRVFRSSRGPLEVRHRAAKEGEGVRVEVVVLNRSEQVVGLALEHPPAGALVAGSARAEGGEIAAPSGDEPLTARFSSLAPGNKAVLSFEVRGTEPRALLQVGPTLILEGP